VYDREVRVTRRQSLIGLAGAMAVRADTVPAPVRLIVLDVGGTIIQDRGDVPEAMIDACAHHGIRITAEDVAPFRGASKREVVRRFVEQKGSGDKDKLSAAVYAEFNSRVIDVYKSVPPIDGAESAFIELRKAGIQLAASTGFGRAVADSIFGRLKWQQYFVTVVTGDDVTLGRPAPFMIFHAMEAAKIGSTADVIAVGDTPLDLQAARNAGVRGIGVLSGAGTEEKLRAEKPAMILKSVAELPKALGSTGTL
jgi:phosphonatase-like hydrolase